MKIQKSRRWKYFKNKRWFSKSWLELKKRVLLSRNILPREPFVYIYPRSLIILTSDYWRKVFDIVHDVLQPRGPLVRVDSYIEQPQRVYLQRQAAHAIGGVFEDLRWFVTWYDAALEERFAEYRRWSSRCTRSFREGLRRFARFACTRTRLSFWSSISGCLPSPGLRPSIDITPPGDR